MTDETQERIYAATDLADTATRAYEGGLTSLAHEFERAARHLLGTLLPTTEETTDD